MTRPKIPVRDGLRFARPLRPTLTPDVGQVECRTCWRWGLVCGLVWGAMLVAVAVAVAWAVSTS